MSMFTRLLKEATKSTKKETIEAVGGISSLVAGIIIYSIQKIGWATIPPGDVDPVLKSVIISIIGFIGTIWMSIVIARDNLQENLIDLTKNIKNILPIDSRIVRIGKIEDAASEIGDAIRDAVEVKNTCVIYVTNKDNFLEKTIKSSERLKEDVSNSVKKGCRWRELITEDAENRAIEIMHKLDDDSNHRFSCRKLKNKQPIINFIILTPRNKKEDKKIYFGFGFHDYNENGNIYATTDNNIIHTFESYFDIIFTKEFSDGVRIKN